MSEEGVYLSQTTHDASCNQAVRLNFSHPLGFGVVYYSAHDELFIPPSVTNQELDILKGIYKGISPSKFSA